MERTTPRFILYARVAHALCPYRWAGALNRHRNEPLHKAIGANQYRPPATYNWRTNNYKAPGNTSPSSRTARYVRVSLASSPDVLRAGISGLLDFAAEWRARH